MMRWIGVAVVAGAVALATPASATAAPQQRQAGKATDFSAQRHHRRHRHHYDGYRPYYRSYDRPYYDRSHDSYYYGRPTYYRPYPYGAPAPFVFGFGFGPFR